MARKSAPYLKVHCHKHPKYLGDQRPKLFCQGCLLLYVLRHQHSQNGPELLGSLNPYSYFLSGVNLEEANGELEVSKV